MEGRCIFEKEKAAEFRSFIRKKISKNSWIFQTEFRQTVNSTKYDKTPYAIGSIGRALKKTSNRKTLLSEEVMQKCPRHSCLSGKKRTVSLAISFDIIKETSNQIEFRKRRQNIAREEIHSMKRIECEMLLFRMQIWDFALYDCNWAGSVREKHFERSRIWASHTLVARVGNVID